MSEQRHNLRGEKSRILLAALEQPGRIADVARELGWPYTQTIDLAKYLLSQGHVDRPARGVYQMNAAGRAALDPARPPIKGPAFVRAYIPRAPEGQGWTPERKAWLDAHYAALGHRAAAEHLGMPAASVHAMANRRGLRAGELEGYLLLSDLADLSGVNYASLYARAIRADVLRFPTGQRGRTRRRKAVVPTDWADEVMMQLSLPNWDEVALIDLCTELSIPQTTLQRLTRGKTVMRRRREGGAARAYVSTEVAEALRLRYRGPVRALRAS